MTKIYYKQPPRCGYGNGTTMVDQEAFEEWWVEHGHLCGCGRNDFMVSRKAGKVAYSDVRCVALICQHCYAVHLVAPPEEPDDPKYFKVGDL